MCLNRRVFAYAKSIYDIEIQFFTQQGVEYLLIDLDNTLDSYRLYYPTLRAINYINSLVDAGIKPIIVSNNRGKRVKTYSNFLQIDCISQAMKPFPKKIIEYLKANDISHDKVMIIGDQLMTDVGAANAANIRVVLTDKIVSEDQWTTRFNRLFDRPLRKRMEKQGKLPNWRTLYGKS
ncbi:MAG TPA: HAD hydrolase-like protein [Bacilli bacterium]|jgi:HAD superfamily phosphatase (TIGR01668 family)|nr:HAD hydrolase-like protein [Bacilli bacterium]HPY79458.1 HAD hydrolase-like protein [Bacilli bacterium]HQA55526.1 HAD hydrolase-like protein [Bacilli bacterium]